MSLSDKSSSYKSIRQLCELPMRAPAVKVNQADSSDTTFDDDDDDGGFDRTENSEDFSMEKHIVSE